MGLLLNRARANTTTTGTGAVTPGSGIVPYQSWASANATPGYWYDYLIEDGNPWEIGTGYYNGTTITRPGPGIDPQFASSTGALLNLSGSAIVSCVANANTLKAPGPFMPPLSSDLPTLTSGDATNLTIANDAEVGLTMDSGTLAGGGDKFRTALKALASSGAADWEVRVRLKGTGQGTNNTGFGITALESATNKQCSLLFSTSGANPIMYFLRGTTTLWSATIASQQAEWREPWFRLVYTNSSGTLAGYWGVNGKQWESLLSVTNATAFTTRADKVGVVMQSNTSGGNNYASVPYWWQSF